MKKAFYLPLILLICSKNVLLAQTIDIPADSLKIILCKKWEVDYAMLGGIKMGRMPGATEINYEFKKDNTFVLTSNNAVEKAKGTWSYDQKNNLVKLITNGKSNTKIISLKSGELIMLVDTKEATPSDPTEIKMVYKEMTN